MQLSNSTKPQANLLSACSSILKDLLCLKKYRENIGKPLAIFLDGQPISVPIVNEAITGGKAQISGNFTPEEAKLLVGRLNSGALPVPISLVSTQTIGPSLGAEATRAGVKSRYHRIHRHSHIFNSLVSLAGHYCGGCAFYLCCHHACHIQARTSYSDCRGIAGFIISIGIAVDANVLIFERIKEELRSGRTIFESTKNGFSAHGFQSAIRTSQA